MKRRPPLFVLAILAACFLIMFATPFADQLLLFPTTNRIDSDGATRAAIPFEKGELEIWAARSRLGKQRNDVDIYVLRFYGNADRAERWVAREADAFGERAVEVWGVNYPGFGGSSGRADLAKTSGAGVTAFDYLKTKSGNKPIVLYGASIGTTVALHVAASRQVAGMLLHNPTPLRQLILWKYGWWNLWLLAGPVVLHIPRDLDSIANAKEVRAPAVFLLAEKDDLVTPRFQRLVVDAYAGDKRTIVLPGAHHNSVLEGIIMADVYNAYDWLLDRSRK